MKNKDGNTNLPLPNQQADNKEINDTQGYPLYPNNEDIYSKYQEEKEINPEDLSKTKMLPGNDRTDNELDFNNELFAGNLDIPGAEMEDDQENIGNEDEENNYYSLGGDDHNDLDENNG